MNAVDTNILVYVHDDRDSRKQRIAAALVDSLEDRIPPSQAKDDFDAYPRIDGLE